MEQQTLKITNVLSDPTRFSIYQYVSRQREDVTVQEIAEQFSIHANVARLHLTKLEDVNMLVSETKKTGKGGRPSRFYRLSEEVISIQFPYRDYQRLAEISLEALTGFGEEGQKALNQIGYKFGKEAANNYILRFNYHIAEMSIKEKLDLVESIAKDQGLNPEIVYQEEANELHLTIYNCPFKELLQEHNHDKVSLCKMHHALISGIFEYFFGDIIIKEKSLMSEEEIHTCSYVAAILT